MAMNLLDIYEKIVMIRSMEYALDDLFKRGLVLGTAHFCIGQEFIPVIVSQYLGEDDFVTSTHRGHGHAIAKNLDVKTFFQELIGKKEGYNLGRGGSQHVICREKNFYANGITGGMVPVASGIAFANKYKKENKVVVAYLGDGGFNEGYVSETLNLSAVLKLPILFVCENNQYAMSTGAKFSRATEIIERARAFGIKSALVEDNDFKKLDEIAKMFIEEVRNSVEPRFIEVRTYRHLGHSKNDLNLYRDKEEEKFWFEKDVLKNIEKELITSGEMSLEQLDKVKESISEKVKNIVEEAVKC